MSNQAIKPIIECRDILVFFDLPQVIEAYDQIGGHYIGLHVGGDDVDGDYLFANVSVERLRGFRAGAIDLRQLIKEPSDGIGWHLGAFAENGSSAIRIGEAQFSAIPEEFLPEDGFFLTDWE